MPSVFITRKNRRRTVNGAPNNRVREMRREFALVDNKCRKRSFNEKHAGLVFTRK